MCTEWTELYTSSQSSRRLDSESRIRIQDFWLLLDPFPDSWRDSMLSDSMKTQNEYNFLENLNLLVSKEFSQPKLKDENNNENIALHTCWDILFRCHMMNF